MKHLNLQKPSVGTSIVSSIILMGLLLAILTTFCVSTPKAKVIPPLSYTVPLHASPVNTAGGTVKIDSANRCNNTGHDLEVDITIFWQSGDNKHLLLFTLPPGSNNANGNGPEFFVVIPPGCVKPTDVATPTNSGSTSNSFPIPADLTPGVWRLRGQVCYGGVSLPGGQVCSAWYTDDFLVVAPS